MVIGPGTSTTSDSGGGYSPFWSDPNRGASREQDKKTALQRRYANRLPGVASDPFLAMSENKQEWMGLMNQGQGWWESVLPMLEQQFGLARQDISGSGRAAKRQTLDREKQTLASLSQDAASRGFNNNTMTQHRQMGAAGETSRTLQQIDANVAQAMAGLRTRQAGMQAGTMGSLADFMAQRAQGQAGMQQQLINQRLGNIDYGRAKDAARKSSMWGAVGSLGGAALGMFGGGMLGGGGAGMAGAQGGGYNPNQFNPSPY